MGAIPGRFESHGRRVLFPDDPAPLLPVIYNDAAPTNKAHYIPPTAQARPHASCRRSPSPAPGRVAGSLRDANRRDERPVTVAESARTICNSTSFRPKIEASGDGGSK
jgi:hypothetical protein